MNLRSRMLFAFAVVVLIPLALLALGLRLEVTRRLFADYQARVDSVSEIIHEDLQRESDGISARLASLKGSLLDDNRFRLGAVAGVESYRDYLLDYAGEAMQLAGLSVLQIQDGDGRIISSGHFRNEHGRMEPELAAALTKTREGIALMTTRSAERGEFLSLVRSETLTISGRTFLLVGGVTVDEEFLRRLARDRAIVISLQYLGEELTSRHAISDTAEAFDSNDAAIGKLNIPLVHVENGTSVNILQARLQVIQPYTPLRILQRSVDSWFLWSAVVAGIAALMLALWLSSRISQPLVELAAKTAALDLDRLDVRFDGGSDEVGLLSRRLGDLTSRLRASTARVRGAERRATIGDLARQINHDIKNGLIPLRNVMRHLEQVERDAPADLQSVFSERRHTMDSSIAYLETLATSYQRLSPRPSQRDCNLKALIEDVVRASQGRKNVKITTQVESNLPQIFVDPIALRRILENLIANAADSLEANPGTVGVSAETVHGDDKHPWIRMVVADTGRGMTKEISGKIFNDFYTTKESGTGLGLSIVRRLVMDLHGSITVESEPKIGTRMIVDIPANAPERT